MNKSELKKTKNSYFDKYIFVFLAALELLMSFTFFGYIHIPPISITFAYIPILIAASLKLCLGDYGIIGRIGGDEFAAMLDRLISKEELQKRLNIFLEEISDILPSSNKVSCSIGACSFQYPADMSELMSKADANLYSAKSRGRACFVLGD